MSDIAEKWGEAVAGRGFAQIPNYLLLLNQFLDEESRLTPIELLVLFQLAGAWWQKDKQPFPSIRTLAARCGASDRQLQRSLNHLVELELIARVKRRSRGIIASNAYDLSPLVAFLNKVSKAFPNGYPRKIDQPVATINKKTALVPTSPEADVKEDAGIKETSAFANIDWLGDDEEVERERAYVFAVKS